MRKNNISRMLFWMFLILGVVISLQFRSRIVANTQKSSSAFDYEQLKLSLVEEIKKGEELKKQEAENIKLREQLESELLNERKDESIVNELSRLRFVSGLTDVKGAGVVVRLNDAPVRTSANPNNEIIHDGDIVRVLNELKKAGAQAISINGERIISTSEQVCAGTLVRINDVRHAVPYEIKAIGNIDRLELALNNSQILSSLAKEGIRVNVERYKEITIEKYKYSVDNLISALEVVKK